MHELLSTQATKILNSHKDPSSENLNVDLHTITNDNCKKHIGITYSMYVSQMQNVCCGCVTWVLKKCIKKNMTHNFNIKMGTFSFS